jgi:hypothetical protein
MYGWLYVCMYVCVFMYVCIYDMLCFVMYAFKYVCNVCM